ncbi:hypothetical protein BJ684DRAFT_16896, partial [Piptocephalis cylindrospora]
STPEGHSERAPRDIFAPSEHRGKRKRLRQGEEAIPVPTLASSTGAAKAPNTTLKMEGLEGRVRGIMEGMASLKGMSGDMLQVVKAVAVVVLKATEMTKEPPAMGVGSQNWGSGEFRGVQAPVSLPALPTSKKGSLPKGKPKPKALPKEEFPKKDKWTTVATKASMVQRVAWSTPQPPQDIKKRLSMMTQEKAWEILEGRGRHQRGIKRRNKAMDGYKLVYFTPNIHEPYSVMRFMMGREGVRMDEVAWLSYLGNKLEVAISKDYEKALVERMGKRRKHHPGSYPYEILPFLFNLSECISIVSDKSLMSSLDSDR